MAKTPEDKIKDSCIEYLQSLEKAGRKIYHERRQATASSKSGLGDVFIVVNSMHIELEFKTYYGEQRTMQEKWEAKCNLLDIPYIVIRSKKELQSFLEENFSF